MLELYIKFVFFPDPLYDFILSTDAPSAVVSEPKPRIEEIDSNSFDHCSVRFYKPEQVKKYGGGIKASFNIFSEQNGNAHYLMMDNGDLINISRAYEVGGLPRNFREIWKVGHVREGIDKAILQNESWHNKPKVLIQFEANSNYKSVFDWSRRPEPGELMVATAVRL